MGKWENGALTHDKEPTFPFPAIVGLDRVKKALLLLATDPGLRGVILAAGAGKGKSIIARSFGSVIPCPLSLVPRHLQGAVSFVEVPMSIAEDQLIGALDVERTIQTGTRQWSDSLLARAAGGVLYVDNINLVDRGILDIISSALEGGAAPAGPNSGPRIISANFVLVGAYGPEEGPISGPLADRVALFVDGIDPLSADEAAEMTGRVLSFESDPVSFCLRYENAVNRIRASVAEARGRLHHIRISREDRRRLISTAIRLGVEGNRADIFAVRVAKAHAALRRKLRVDETDLMAAVEYVLIPRRSALMPGSVESGVRSQESEEGMNTERGRMNDKFQRESSSVFVHRSSFILHPSDLPIAYCPLPENILGLEKENPIRNPQSAIRNPRARGGKRAGRFSHERGRYVAAVPKTDSQSRGHIALEATIRSAAIKQPARENRTGLAITIGPGDLWVKQFKEKVGTLFILVVDASGSMALNRISQAKGALEQILRRAYVGRDRVALISFRGTGAEVLLPPSRSVELAKRSVGLLAVGGGTPMAAGLLEAHNIAQRARRQDHQSSVLVLLTDGRANMGKNAAADDKPSMPGQPELIWRELEQIGKALQREAVNSVVLDTKQQFMSNGDGQRLADLLGGRYFYLPQADPGSIYDVLQTVSRDP
jgi:magnesium chelatase subunit D